MSDDLPMTTQQEVTADLDPIWTRGWRLRRALAFGTVSVGSMAEHLGYERKALTRWMNDTGKPPRDGIMKEWALKTGVRYLWIKDGSGSPFPNPDERDSVRRILDYKSTPLTGRVTNRPTSIAA